MSSELNSLQDLQVGNMVTIRSRMWPGINKPGGAGRILKLHYNKSNDTIITHVNVQYVVMGGKELNISIEYVTTAPDLEYKDSSASALRDRGTILGRCTNCGSLRRDCDSCDKWVDRGEEEHVVKKHGRRKELRAVEEASESSSSDDMQSILNMVKINRRKYRSWQKKHDLMRRRFIGEEEVDFGIPHPEYYSSAEEGGDSSSKDDSASNDDFFAHENSKYADDDDDDPLLFRRSEKFESDDDAPPEKPAKRRLMKKSSLYSVESTSLDRDNFISNLYAIRETGSASRNNSTIPNINEANDHLDNFLQPEGDAEILPQDITDLTATLSSKRLLSFFDDLADHLEYTEMPKIKEINYSTLKADPLRFYEKFRNDLISYGTDQCQTCLQRLQNSKYRNELEGKDLRMSHLNDLVEDIMRPLNKLVKKLDRRPVSNTRGDDDPILFRRSEEFESTRRPRTNQLTKKRKSKKLQRKKQVLSVEASSFDTDSSSSTSKKGDTPKANPVPAQSQQHKMFIPTIHKKKDAVMNLNENNDYLDGFLQPEGNAETLPNEIIDRTANLSDDDLLAFFDNLADQLEHEHIPKAKDESASSSCNPKLLHDKFRRDLIWNGTDQCRICFSRLLKGKYRKKLDARDLRMEQLNELVEDVMRPLNKRISVLDRQEEEDDWIQESEAQGGDLRNIFSEIERNPDVWTTKNKNNAHPFATKRKNTDDALSIMKKHKASRKESRKQHSSRKSKGKTMEIGQFLKRRKKKRRSRRIPDEQDSCSSSSSEDGTDLSALFPSNAETPSSSKTGKSTRRKNGVSYLRRNKINSSNANESIPKGKKQYSTGYKSQYKRKEKKMHNIYYMKNKNQQGNTSSSSSSSEEENSSFPTIQSLFKTLKKSSYTPPPSSEDTSVSLEDMHTIQAELQTNYPHAEDESYSSLLDLQKVIRSMKHNPNGNVTKCVCSILKELVQKYGQMSLLQFMNDPVSTADRFQLHITLLQTIVLYITHTSAMDCAFHPKPQELLDVIILQIIDVIYAHVLPSTWTHVRHKHWWNYLEPLCKVLATQIESICRLIWNKVTHPKQHLMKQNGITSVFVTFINPVAYSDFLSGGDWKLVKEENRMSYLIKQNLMPMDEVNALWSLILYFASFCKDKDYTSIPSTPFRWRILMLLLLKPQFSSSTVLELGIRYFSLLLDSKVMDPLPSEDSILIKLLEKSVCSCNTKPTISTKKKEKIFIKLVESEKASNLFGKNMTDIWNRNEPSSALKEKGFELEWMIHRLLLPDVSVLNTCVYLLSSWIASLPLNKKARRVRFDRAVEKCLSNLATQNPVNTTKELQPSPNFSEVFGTKVNNHDLTLDVNPFFPREAAGVLLWKITCSTKLNFEFCQKIWKLLSTESMRDVQHTFYRYTEQQGNESYSFPSHDKNKEAPNSLASTCFKILYPMLLFSVQYSSPSSVKKNVIYFLFSCLLSCLHASCFASHSSYPSIRCSNIHAITTMNISFTCLMDVVSPFLLRRSFTIISDIMEPYIPSLVDLTPLMEGHLTTDICFRSCLILLQTWTRSIYRSLDEECMKFICDNGEKENEKQVHDYFEDINDDAFLNIDLDVLVATVKTNNQSENNGNDSSIAHTEGTVTVEAIALKQEENIDLLLQSHKFLQSFLRNLLVESKPSSRYTIKDTISNGINNIGKELLERQADQICSYIVYLFIFPFHNNICYRGNNAPWIEQDLLFSSPNGSRSNDFFQDALYFLNLNRIICEQFCRVLVHYPKHAKVMFQRNDKLLSQIISCFLCSLVDSSILHEFPTSNFMLLKKKGGEVCRNTEEALLARVQYAEKVDSEKEVDVDVDSAGLFRSKKKRVVCKLNVYLCRYLWTFGKNLGNVMKHWSEEMPTTRPMIKQKQLILDLSELFSEGHSFNKKYNSTNGIPPSSLENECWKRMHILNDFFTSVSLATLDEGVIFVSNNENISFLLIICAVVRCIIEQTVYTYESVRYFDECAAGKTREERSVEEKYERAKALALFEAYAELAVTCFSCLIRLAGTIPNRNIAQQTLHSHIKFIRDFIIVPVLNSVSNIRVDLITTIHISESGGNEVRGIPKLNFIFDPSVVRSISASTTTIVDASSSSRFVESMWNKIRRRLLELVLHIAAGKPDSQSSTSTLYHAVLQRAGLERNISKCGKENDYFALLLGQTLHSDVTLLDFQNTNILSSEKGNSSHHNFPASTILGQCADDYCHVQLHTRMTNTNNVKEMEIKHICFLREFVLTKFLFPKLGFSGVPLIIQCRILKMLESLFGMNDYRDASTISSYVTIKVSPRHCIAGVDEKGFLHLSDVCILAKSLILCLRQVVSGRCNDEKNDGNTIFELIFSLACAMTTFCAVKDDVSSSPSETKLKLKIYQWSEHNISSQEDNVVISKYGLTSSGASAAADYLVLFFSVMQKTAKILSSSKSSSPSTLRILQKCCQSDSNHQWNSEDDNLFDFATSIDIDFHTYYNLWRRWEERTKVAFPLSYSYHSTKRNDFKNSYTKQPLSKAQDASLSQPTTEDNSVNIKKSISPKLSSAANKFLSLYISTDNTGNDASEMEVI